MGAAQYAPRRLAERLYEMHQSQPEIVVGVKLGPG
jgi:hypothetical protein